MWRQSAHNGEASALLVCAGATVRLRLSLRDRIWSAARWTGHGLAGTVVVLWFGAAFLAAGRVLTRSHEDERTKYGSVART
jgi:hypothetical protein